MYLLQEITLLGITERIRNNMTILDTVKIKNMLDDLVNANALNLKEFKFRIEKLGYIIHKLELQTASSSHNDATLIVKDINNNYYTIGV